MEKTKILNRPVNARTWEEESGLLSFLSKIQAEVTMFDKIFDFGVEVLPSPPKSIDGNDDVQKNVAFVIVRRNSAIIGRDYCLYSILKDTALHGYIGVYAGEAIETVRELKPMVDFSKGTASLRAWLRELMRASCEKI